MNLNAEGISSRPITLKDLVRDNEAIRKAYTRILPACNNEDQEILLQVLRIASDGLCNICHEMNIDPLVLDYWDEDFNSCITPFPPDVE